MRGRAGRDQYGRSAARPRVLVVAPSAELYGSDRALLQAMPALIQEFDVTVAVPAAGPGLAELESMAEVVLLPDYALRRRHLTAVGFLPWLWRCLVSLVRLQRHHREGRFAMVYSNTLAAPLGPVLKLLWRVVQAVHVHERPVSPAWLPKVLLAVLRASADLVVCNSRFTRDWLTEHQPVLAERSLVVHNGVEPLAPPPVTSPDPDAFRITCVGRIHPKKGQAVLLEAARMARHAGHRWVVHFYGDALPEHRELESHLKGLVDRYGLQDQVRWHGFETDPYVRYGDVDVAVVPSVQAEEFSLVSAEAQAMLLPVVATGPGGPSEVLLEGRTGLIVPPNEPEALYEALLSLESDPHLRQRMGRDGRAHVLTNFSVNAYARRLTEALAQAIRAAELARKG